MRSLRRYWKSRTIIKGLATPVLYAAALLVGCDSDGEPTAPLSPGRDAKLQADLGGLTDEYVDWTQLVDFTLVANNVVQLNDPAGAAEELPGLGHKFQLFFGMVDDQDPENSTNDVISLEATQSQIGIAFRNFPPGIKIAALDGQINLKYFFEAPRTCFGGSPRITLLVDSDGDGQFNFAAHGHVNPPVFGACPTDQWRIEDLTDLLKRWEVTPATAVTPACGPAGSLTTCTWDELELRITTNFPNHKILAGFLLDGESCSFAPTGTPGCGTAYYDLVTLENRTLENDQDTVRK
jgi:hypothetical protein